MKFNKWHKLNAIISVVVFTTILCGCVSPQRQTYDVNVYIQNVEDRNKVKVYDRWREDSFWDGDENGDHYVIWYEYSPNEGKTVGLYFIGGKFDKDNTMRRVAGLLRNIVQQTNNTQNIYRLYVTDTEKLATIRLK